MALREFGLVITPLPKVVHAPPVALVTVPSRSTVFMSLQSLWSPPALATGTATKFIRTLLKTEGHIPAMVDKDKVTPELLSEAEGW